MDDEEEDIIEGIQWVKPLYFLNRKSFIPSIHEGVDDVIPEGYNTVKIQLDGSLQADISWKKECNEAHRLIENGYFIFWEIELGLFSRLNFPLAHQSQHLSLVLSLDHFRDVIWKEFGSHSIGLSFYRGSADFSESFPWDDQQLSNLKKWIKDGFEDEKIFEEEVDGLSIETIEISTLEKCKEGKRLLSLFCRDVAVEYLKLLTNRLSDSIPRYILVDASGFASDPLWQAQLLNLELFEQISLIVKGSTINLEALGWNSSTPFGSFGSVNQMVPKSCVSVGICLPSFDSYRPSQYKGLDEALKQLMDGNVAFRLIPESYLTTSWDGLDYLIFVPGGLSSQGKRKLQGFCAAGGTAVTLGNKIGLSQEIHFGEYFASSSVV